MKILIKKIYKLRKLYLVFAAIILQVVWFLVTLTWLSEVSSIFSGLMTALSALAIIWLINQPKAPEMKLAWVVPILILPVFGGVLFFFIELNLYFSRRKGQYISELQRENAHLIGDNSVLQEIKAENYTAASQCSYLSNNSFPVYKHTSSTYFPMAIDAYEDLLECLQQAKRYIFLEYFIIEEQQMWNSIFSILIQKAKAGVEVRLLYDDLACKQTLSEDFCQRMTEFGIQCRPFNPIMPILSVVMDNRDHRKMTIIDGQVAFTGGFNLADEYINITHPYGVWKDIGVKLQGDAVDSMTMMFLIMWDTVSRKKDDLSYYIPKHPRLDEDSYVQPYFHAPYQSGSTAETVYMNLINQSHDYLYIYTPYLIIDHGMQEALIMAAQRGVDVRIILPGIPDKKVINVIAKATYNDLISQGVHIYEYTPGFVHAKGMVSDDILAVIGTVNLDYRSLYHHFENGCLFYKSAVVSDMKCDFEKTLQDCQKIVLVKQKHSMLKSACYAILRAFAPLL